MTAAVARRGRIVDIVLAVMLVPALGIYAVVLLPIAQPPPAPWLPSGQAGDMMDIVAARYPIGSTGHWVEAELVAAGFHAERSYQGYDRAFVIDRGGFPCNDSWRVMWTSRSDGTLGSIAGYHAATCL